MLYDLDETIKAILRERGGLPAAEIDIAFDAPDREWSGKINRPTVNCYLYDIRENLDRRQAGWEHLNGSDGRTAARRRPPRWFDMSYVCTAWTNDVEDEHHLLWRVLATFARFPELPTEQLQGRLREITLPITSSTAQPGGLLRNPAEVWSALENRIRPSVNYVVTLPLEAVELIEAPLVISKRITLAPVPGGSAEELTQIAGVVRDAGGRPLAGAAVGVAGHGLETTTDAAGRFTFVGLASGSYTLVATAPTGGRRAERAERDVHVPGGDYDLTVSAGSTGRRR